MASMSPVYSNYQFHPDELSELMSMMAQENYSGSTFSGGAASSTGTNISPLEDDLDVDIINVINPQSYGRNISDPDHHFGAVEFDVTSPAMGSFSQHQNQQVLGMYDRRTEEGYSNQLVSDSYEFGAKSYGHGFMSNSNFVSPLTAKNLGIQYKETSGIFENNNVKVGRYTEEERRDRIMRYLKKRSQRNFNKKIKYICRKTLADSRVRVRGRFVRHNKEPCKEEVIRMEQNGNCPQQNNGCYYRDISQIKMADEEEWLQEAMASFLYVPYISG